MSSPPSPDQLKSSVRHYLETTWSLEDLDDIPPVPEQDDSQETMHPYDALRPFTGPLRIYLGGEQLSMSLAQARKDLRKTFPDIHLTVTDLLIEEEKVAARWIMHGTDLGGYDDHLPTGKSIHITGSSMLRLENHCIMEAWVEADIAGMLRQLGYVYIPQPPRITMRRSGPSFYAKKEET